MGGIAELALGALIGLSLWGTSLHSHSSSTGCQSNPQHLGWSRTGNGWQGGEYSRPRCWNGKEITFCDIQCQPR